MILLYRTQWEVGTMSCSDLTDTNYPSTVLSDVDVRPGTYLALSVYSIANNMN